MRIIRDAGRLVWSASDLKASADCEFAWMRQVDAKLGRCPLVEDPADEMLERAASLGDAHEARTLEAYRAAHPGAVVEIERASSADPDALAAAVQQTADALADPAVRVVFQAAFSADDFVGFADFLVRDEAGRWRVQDTKLARTARVSALMQLAAYVDRLRAAGVDTSDQVDLLLGDGSVSTHEVADLLPLFEVRRARLRALVADRDLAAGSGAEPIAWGETRGALDVRACGRCATCEVEVLAHRDVLLVAGMRPASRERLRRAGIETIDALAAATARPERMSEDAFEALVAQARLQVETERSGDAAPRYEVAGPEALGTMPRPDRGDIFFDFEGDPLFSERAGDGRVAWGIDYLFGWVDMAENYTAIWAHDLAAEKRALERFCDFVAARRRAHPDMHIYHYAPYETSHLTAMAARHGVREADVDRMLRDELFVDLYPIVKRAIRVGSRSYSIKKLEPLYMGSEVRMQDVTKGDQSIGRYVEARRLAATGEEDAARRIDDDLADYNRYDCVSTRRLRDWLVERAREARVLPAPPEDRPRGADEPSPRALALSARAEELREAREAADPRAEPTHDERALRLASAAIDYYPREARSFWQAHFERLHQPVALWGETRDVLVVDAAETALVSGWHTPEGARSERRRLLLRGDLAPGSRLAPGSTPYALYAAPAPFPSDASARWLHVARQVTVVEHADDGIVVDEYAADGRTWGELPLALTPAAPPRAGAQQGAIDEWADSLLRGERNVGAADGAFPIDPATDILRGLRADHHAGRVVSQAIGSDIDAIVLSLLSVPTYLAVQGPPGTGKTYVGSHVIARLVNDHGWRVGVVAQSHAVVENMLDRVVGAGVARERVGKVPKRGADTGAHAFQALPYQGLAEFQRRARGGVVIGGTAWDLANVTRVERRSLDLLVIDEAGQFSLASTIAVSMAARRLLLLGDPQQLPQVSQGTHPAPIDTSALGWLMRGASVLPDGHGYFLERTWRMHPELARPVSELSYGGRLRARDGAELRTVAGVDPGLHPRPVVHRGNATESAEEAAEVVAIVRDVLGRGFVDIDIDDDQNAAPRAERPLEESDVIVVAPYNAHQQAVERALAAAGLSAVRVGTVDRFQGQEAAIAILTLAASSGRDAPRGLEFLLLPNRLNVGISRAKVAAFLVHSPALLDDLPFASEQVAALSGFARLTGAAAPAGQPAVP
ncbi:TM0106 family RecB-like putative nuclease [Microbacterium excoecariae]|uniref:TM0106 family RecB-like putative nuclease n=1 Tax=Microbacterium excoecariae TaxID=2715210 RepID=UPI00140B1F1C|nr:bifunctional RecB family nuclease/DEAD/DEAH box helicase [Microbacterium excoecariae]NHI16338.1 TM0106 family RecB-like putative nuclease [Microbacterium excoecariae]